MTSASRAEGRQFDPGQMYCSIAAPSAASIQSHPASNHYPGRAARGAQRAPDGELFHPTREAQLQPRWARGAEGEGSEAQHHRQEPSIGCAVEWYDDRFA